MVNKKGPDPQIAPEDDDREFHAAQRPPLHRPIPISHRRFDPKKPGVEELEEEIKKLKTALQRYQEQNDPSLRFIGLDHRFLQDALAIAGPEAVEKLIAGMRALVAKVINPDRASTDRQTAVTNFIKRFNDHLDKELEKKTVQKKLLARAPKKKV